jgi:hypothetical protein
MQTWSQDALTNDDGSCRVDVAHKPQVKAGRVKVVDSHFLATWLVWDGARFV